jgi:hypothetical protein
MQLNTANRQIVAFRIGVQVKEDAQALFDKIPPFSRPAPHCLQIFGKVTGLGKRKKRGERNSGRFFNFL